jgi:hypothetical protein
MSQPVMGAAERVLRTPDEIFAHHSRDGLIRAQTVRFGVVPKV